MDMKKPILVMMAFANPILVRAVKDILGNIPTIHLSEGELSTISCDRTQEIDVILCETEKLAQLESDHVCLAPKTLGISVWENMISVSKGDLQTYENLEEIVEYIEKISNQEHKYIKCDICTSESKLKNK